MKYISVKIPKKLSNEIQEFIKSNKNNLGFRSVNEFVLDTVRRKLEVDEK